MKIITKKPKESYVDQLRIRFRNASQNFRHTEAAYYAERIENCLRNGGCACADFDTFIHSWAGEQWLENRKREGKI